MKEKFKKVKNNSREIVERKKNQEKLLIVKKNS